MPALRVPVGTEKSMTMQEISSTFGEKVRSGMFGYVAIRREVNRMARQPTRTAVCTA